MALTSGTRLGPYEILGAIGAGGMGEVYRARDTKLHRDVAIKILPAALAADPAACTRFEREAQAVAALSHPNILGIFDVGIEHEVPFAVMELLDGATLREQLHDGAVGPRKALEYAQQMAAGLGAAHARGITHRDLKPENIFVTRDGQIKILDFGLAKIGPSVAASGPSMLATSPALTGVGTIVGTVGYMSPEQVRGRDVDHRSDIFSFGAILYELLAGHRAFTGDSAVETMNAILKDDPPELTGANAALPPALDRIVRRCLEKNPEERFQSARDVAFALDAVSTTRSDASLAGIPSVVAPRRTATAWRVGAIVAFGLAVGAIWIRRRHASLDWVGAPPDPADVRAWHHSLSPLRPGREDHRLRRGVAWPANQDVPNQTRQPRVDSAAAPGRGCARDCAVGRDGHRAQSSIQQLGEQRRPRARATGRRLAPRDSSRPSPKRTGLRRATSLPSCAA